MLLFTLFGAVVYGAVPVPMSSQPGLTYTEYFGDIASWAADFSSGIGANRFGALVPGGSEAIPNPTRITTASTNWVVGSSGGKQKGSGTLILLSTGSPDTTTSVAVDFYMDFTGVSAGTLSFDWASLTNGAGNRRGSVRVYGSTDGTSFAELTDAQVLNFQNDAPTNGTISSAVLPSEFNNNAGARLRFYYYNGMGGTSGARPKFSLDNLAVTAGVLDEYPPSVTITNPSSTSFSVASTATTYAISGTCNTGAVGQLRWTNNLTGNSGQGAAATNWIISGISIALGDNLITVAVTNRAGTSGNDHVTISRDSLDYFTVMSANLSGTIGGESAYGPPAQRIFKGLAPDVVAVQEWFVTNASVRAFVTSVFGADFDYYREPYAAGDLPNGIISRWPITASGEWNDPGVDNRDFAWATINLPGTQDLHVVSVHFKSGDAEATRKDEAEAITNYVYKAKWPATDFIVIAGDLNTPSRGDDGLRVLTNIVCDNRQPTDQENDDDTNVPRNYPYDYVLPNQLLNINHATLTVDGITFSNGMVFDSRVWATPPTPIQTNDSAETDMQHLAVMKRFSLRSCTDCDEDAMLDSWETANFGNTTSASASSDYDGDGFIDPFEYLAGTQPTNKASALNMNLPSTPVGTNCLVQWDSVTAKHYRIQRATNILNGFTSLKTNILAAPPANTFTDTAPPSAQATFYRVRLDP